MSTEHYENFPVASWLCPSAIRPAVVAIYQFARTADDLADEGPAAAAERLADLSAYRADLVAACAGRATSARWATVFGPLTVRVAQYTLPSPLLHDLLDAFEQDVQNPHYADRASLLDYCLRSANPIGRLLLHLYGVDDAQALREADAVCTALQLINFWQDLSIDGPRGRQYVPDSDLATHGVTRAELAACHDSPRSRAMIRALCQWARGLMREGAPLALRIPGRAGWELRLVVQGGLQILDKIARMDHASLTHRPKLTATDLPLLLWRAAGMRQVHQVRQARL